MKQRLVMQALAVMGGVLCASGPPAMADELNLNLRNVSIAPVAAIRVSADYQTSWGGNLLNGPISPGQSGQITLFGRNGHCFFDIQVEDTNGRSAEYWGRNLCADTVLEHR